MRHYVQRCDPLLWVDVGSRLVHEQDGVVREDGPSQTHELPLPHTQVAAAFRQHVL